ncbi:outer membrane protein transport protein [Vibrio lentus]|nr:outer membrane protein transport protein [Vibrio lentus]
MGAKSSQASRSRFSVVDEADGWAVGFNVGTVYELDENNRFGLSYRYSPGNHSQRR